MTMTRTCAYGVAITMAFAVVPTARAQGTQVLFPQPFVIEHGIVAVDPDGGLFATEPVTDYYGGVWIVSERVDQSRRIVDFSRREITEIVPQRGSYSVLSFDRFAELQQRLASAEADPVGEEDRGEKNAPPEAPQLAIEELAPRVGKESFINPATRALLERPGVRHVRVTAAGDSPSKSVSSLEAWFDPTLRLSPVALDMLDRFEEQVLGATAPKDRATPSGLLAAARRHAEGAVVLRTSRPNLASGAGGIAGTLDDLAVRIERLDAFPQELLTVPEGYRRVAHPLEMMVAWAEQEAELNARMNAHTAQ
jgi:hypothetical protein